MSTTVETAARIRPFQIEFAAEQIEDLRRSMPGTWAARSYWESGSVR